MLKKLKKLYFCVVLIINNHLDLFHFHPFSHGWWAIKINESSALRFLILTHSKNHIILLLNFKTVLSSLLEYFKYKQNIHV